MAILKIATTEYIVPGSRKDIVLQCVDDAGNPAMYAQGDTLSAEVWPASLPSRLFAASASWYTSKGRQSGYDQGQVIGSLTSAQSATLQPTGRYYLRIWRALAADPSESEEIATVLLIARKPAPG